MSAERSEGSGEGLDPLDVAVGERAVDPLALLGRHQVASALQELGDPVQARPVAGRGHRPQDLVDGVVLGGVPVRLDVGHHVALEGAGCFVCSRGARHD